MLRPLALCCLALVLAAAPASATTVEVVDAYPDPLGLPEFQPEVRITDHAGEINSLGVSYTYETTGEAYPPPGNAVVTVQDDSAPLEAGSGCEAAGSKRVRCDVEGLRVIQALLGPGADTATVEAPPGGTSCGCVTLSGGDGEDRLTSSDGAGLQGDGGNDVLDGRTSAASRTLDGLDRPSDDELVGGDGHDVLDGGLGRDGLVGGAGDDVLRAGDGDDRLMGGAGILADGTSPPAGRDKLDGGDGNDSLSDGDDEGGEIGPDMVVGGPGFDEVTSYIARLAAVRVDLSRAAGDGQAGEQDWLVNVETVFGGRGDDTLVGDGDGNILHAGAGANRLRGRGGDDGLYASSTARNAMSGDRGDDYIEAQAWTTGPVNCGRGHDNVVQPPRGENAPRHPSDRDPGVKIAASCEAVAQAAPGGWGVDPVPNRSVSNRTLTFDRPRGHSHRDHFTLVVTPAEPPYRVLGRGTSRSHGVSVRLPAAIARRARRTGMALRAEVYSGLNVGPPRLRMIWRFRVPRAR